MFLKFHEEDLETSNINDTIKNHIKLEEFDVSMGTLISKSGSNSNEQNFKEKSKAEIANNFDL